MKAPLALFTAACAALADPAQAQKPDEQAALSAIAERGRLLYEVDRAAWVATDDLLARAPEAKSWPVKGWIVERGAEAGAYIVTFYGDGPAAPAAFFVARVKDGKVVEGKAAAASARPPLTEAQLALARARDAAAANVKARPCTSGAFNTAVLPPDRPGAPIDVYMLSPQVQHEVYPFGGHHLLRISPDGTVAERRQFTKSCLNMPRRAPGEQSDPAGIGTTHLLGPLPTEIHVFTSYTAGLPVFVMTAKPKRVWLVDKDRISRTKLK